MHYMDTWPQSVQRRLEEAKNGKWVLYEPVKQGMHTSPFKVEITNLDELQEQNPMFTNRLHLSLSIELQNNFRGRNTQIMI